MLFQLVLLKLFKSELFSCLQKVDHVFNSSKGPIRACLHGGKGPQVGEVTRLDGGNPPVHIISHFNLITFT